MKTFKILFLVFVLCEVNAQVTFFADIPGVNGEYLVPAFRTTKTTPPKSNCTLVQGFQLDFIRPVFLSGGTLINTGRRQRSVILSIPADKSSTIWHEYLVLNKTFNELDLFQDIREGNTVINEFQHLKLLNAKVEKIDMSFKGANVSYEVNLLIEKVIYSVSEIESGGKLKLAKLACYDFVNNGICTEKL